MKLPYCTYCGGRSELRQNKAGEYSLCCLGCRHEVRGHVKPEAAAKAFLWIRGPSGVNGQTADQTLACGCPNSGCVHRMFETLPLVAG